MYIVINPDQTLNAIVASLDHLCLESGFDCVELPEQTPESILGDIPIEEARWDSDLQTIIHDPEFVVGGEAWRQRKASERIHQFYPLSTQINLLRSGDKSSIKTMSTFIDQCRQWSNDESLAVDRIDQITPIP